MSTSEKPAFVVAVNPLWGHALTNEPEGPVCECGEMECVARLPSGAWQHVTSGQFVVLPSHVNHAFRVVHFDGWSVEEADSQ